MLYIYILLLLFLGFVAVYLFLRRKVTMHKPEAFPTEENRKLQDENKKTVVCLGDSNTHGNVSYDWVRDLKEDLPNYQIFNAGLNSDLSFSLLRRLDDVVDCKPDFVNLLIGTNDVNASYSEKSLERYVSTKKILKSETPSIVAFEENLERIVSVLQKKTNAKIAIMTLPLMGEDLMAETNKMADAYSDVILEVAKKFNLKCLDIRSEQKEFLQKNPSQTRYKFDQYFLLLNKAVFLYYIFGYTWDRISQLHKTQLSPDFLHQNAVSGKMIKQHVLNWINNNE
jgi:lysophospholipase L1-like esterase